MSAKKASPPAKKPPAKKPPVKKPPVKKPPAKTSGDAAGSASSRALDHAATAYGRGQLKEGFAFDAEMDLLFALGWPHIRFLVDGHPDDAAPTTELLDALTLNEGGYGVRWPRGMANRFVRAYATDPRKVDAGIQMSAPLFADASPISEELAREFIATLPSNQVPSNDYLAEHFALLLEAMLGTRFVVETFLATFEAAPSVHKRADQALSFVTTLAIMLVRLPPPDHARAKERLAALAKKFDGVWFADYARIGALGGAGAKAIGLNPSFYASVDNDPAAILDSVEAGLRIPSVRYAFLGGPKVLVFIECELKKMLRIRNQAYQQIDIAEQLGEVRSREAVRILGRLAAGAKVIGGSKAKKQAAQVLARRSDYARPILERAAAGKDVPKGGITKEEAAAALAAF